MPIYLKKIVEFKEIKIKKKLYKTNFNITQIIAQTVLKNNNEIR